MATARATVFSTELGWLAAVWAGRQLLELTFGHDSPQDAVKRLQANIRPSDADAFMRRLTSRLQNYASGENGDDFLDVQLIPGRETPFERAVVERCRHIARGQTLSYGELAAEVGHPRAARAVGNVMRKNRWPLIVPCHRVVAAGRRMGGYSAPDGISMKERLLTMEGAQLLVT